MAQIPASLIRNLSFPFDTIGKPVEAVGQCEELVSAARLVRVLVGYPPKRFGDARRYATLDQANPSTAPPPWLHSHTAGEIPAGISGDAPWAVPYHPRWRR
jgi:hypothetical protein